MDITSYLLGKNAGGGSEINNQNKNVTITTNGSSTVSADAGYTGLGTVGITTNVQPNLETLTETITENGTTTYTPSQNKDGFSSVSITTNVSGGSDLDWSALGFNGRPQTINDGYNYAVQIMNTWDATSTMESKFLRDTNLVFMPLVDISKASNLSNMFQYCNGLIQVADLDYSKASYLDYIFGGCNQLKSISNFNANGRLQYSFDSCNKLETIQGNLKPISLRNAFNSCASLKNIPVIDGSNIYGTNSLQGAFTNCPSLTDTSLDNILQMCVSATSYNGTKTLVKLGFVVDNYPASRIQALPHYQDFINAGWTIGY